MPKFPDRWFDYSNTGDVIQGTRLVTFKVPLKETFFNNSTNIPEDARFTPSSLMDCMLDRGLKLGLVVDLTFTDRYYDPEEFTHKGVQYQKIFVAGHVIPKQEVIDKFYETVDQFLESSDKNSLVGVHCTHGVNRTGYVVCRYMVERLGMKATDALEAYKTARGYPVERRNYINDLKKRAGEHAENEEENEQKSPSRDGRNENINQDHMHSRRDDSVHANWRGGKIGQNHGRGGYYGQDGNRGGYHSNDHRERWHNQNGKWGKGASYQNYRQGHQYGGRGARKWRNDQYTGQYAYGWSGNQYCEDYGNYWHNDYGYGMNGLRQGPYQYHWTNRSNNLQAYQKGQYSAGENDYPYYEERRSYHGPWRKKYRN